MKIVWSPLALERVESIAKYIAEDKPSAALNWVSSLFSCVDRLVEFPESGRVVPEVRLQRIREVVFGSYRVIYSVTNQVDILTVRRSSHLLKTSELGADET
ncbi:type II toxin-antitoxin system RelE/ParE family toxin [Aliidiomarina haloalkalitolerans]|uniref:Plasmid stabilization protein n=1 Tax=Aliidiomarina haloalkalitolerans TaxID=859059 RepID=A0A432VXJ1_9GAMM|nr:type II toxin-antitoxin system RelE/ParE family toxin [Aliidiomarina haloalkalitolerans]RUO21389.1 plasmid stabilization protein [Aliidiomarina haloalkalitolerans]